jgi:L-malate glycosyltransferase
VKLCIIANPNSAHTRRWINQFSTRGHEVHLLGEHALQETPPENCTFHDLPARSNFRKLRYIGWTIMIRRIIREIDPDVLHALGVTSAGWLGAVSGFHPFLVTALGSDLLLMEKRSRLHQALNRWVLRRLTYLTCQSEGLGKKAAALGVAPDQYEVALFGVDTHVFRPAENRYEIRNELGLPYGPLILSIRAMNPTYNPLDLAHSIPLVLAKHPDAHFAVQTYNQDPVIFAQFREIIQGAGAAQSVTYVSDLPDDRAIAAYYSAADMAISIPGSDGTPISVLESMACATPVIAYDIPAAQLWVQHALTGLLAPPGNIPLLATAISRLAQDTALRLSLGRAAQKLILEKVDTRVCMDRYEAIYRALAEGYPVTSTVEDSG